MNYGFIVSGKNRKNFSKGLVLRMFEKVIPQSSFGGVYTELVEVLRTPSE
jgi:hypothetical protein